MLLCRWNSKTFVGRCNVRGEKYFWGLSRQLEFQLMVWRSVMGHPIKYKTSSFALSKKRTFCISTGWIGSFSFRLEEVGSERFVAVIHFPDVALDLGTVGDLVSCAAHSTRAGVVGSHSQERAVGMVFIFVEMAA